MSFGRVGLPYRRPDAFTQGVPIVRHTWGPYFHRCLVLAWDWRLAWMFRQRLFFWGWSPLGDQREYISAQTLMELETIRSRRHRTSLGAAVFDDIPVVLGLSIFVADWGRLGGGACCVSLIFCAWCFTSAGAYALGSGLPRLSVIVERLSISKGLVALLWL